MPRGYPNGSALWAKGTKLARVGRTDYEVPDRAALRWQADPELLLVRDGDEVRVYCESGEVPTTLEERRALALRWGGEAPFSEWPDHRSVVPPLHADEG